MAMMYFNFAENLQLAEENDWEDCKADQHPWYLFLPAGTQYSENDD